MRKIKNTFFIFITSIFLTACLNSNKYEITDLDKLEKISLKYLELPKKVKTSYGQYALSNHELDTLINFNSKLSIKMYHTSFDENFIELIGKGFIHIFTINDIYLLKLKANQGDPFIFYDNSFFYTEELNLAKYNYKESIYRKIDLSNIKGLNQLLIND